MDDQASTLDFALIGHLDTWEKISNVVHALRGHERNRLSFDDLRGIVPWIPPRTIVRIKTWSHPGGKESSGVYIDTFITPDDLNVETFHKNITRVREAAEYAIREGARIAALGGFTSIVLEGDIGILPGEHIAFTTGNTLTAAYIVKSIEVAVRQLDLDLKRLRLLIVGSTGDVGSGCAAYFAGKVEMIDLCARNIRKLGEQLDSFLMHGIPCTAATDPLENLGKADIVIMAASTAAPMFSLDGCKYGAIVCDAGYPKNSINESYSLRGINLYHGGMGRALGGFYFEPDLMPAFYEYPLPYIGHGCVFEGILLAFENRFESFSKGRGNITPEKIEEIWEIAQKHGYVLAPFFNHEGILTLKHPTH